MIGLERTYVTLTNEFNHGCSRFLTLKTIWLFFYVSFLSAPSDGFFLFFFFLVGRCSYLGLTFYQNSLLCVCSVTDHR